MTIKRGAAFAILGLLVLLGEAVPAKAQAVVSPCTFVSSAECDRVSASQPLPVTGSFTPPVLQNVNLTQVGSSAVALGQAAMAASIPVVLSSNQTAITVTGAGGTFPVTGTFWQATQPISAASLPLPTSAATAANQTNVEAASTQNVAAPASGILMLGQFTTTPTTITSTNVSPLQMNNAGILLVSCASGCSGSGGTSYANASTFTGQSGATSSNPMGLAAVSSAPTLTTGKLYSGFEDLSGNMFVNCAVGCAGGSTSNATSGVATSSTNGASVAWNYGFNGTTWDQLQVDGSKNLKVLVNAALPAGTNVIGHVIADSGSTTAVTQATASSLNATVIGAGTAGTANAGVITVQGIASMTPVQVSQATAANLNATVVGTGTFATQATQAGTWNIGTVTTVTTVSAVTAITNALPAGTNVIGHVIVDTAPTTAVTCALCALESGGNLATLAGGVSSSVYQENIKQVNGTTVLVNTGAVGAGSPRIAVGTDTATIAGSAPGTAGSASTNVVSVQGIAAGTPLFVSEQPATAGGLTVYNVEPAASDNHANIKNGAGQVYHITVTNNSATINYLRLYNAATGFNGCGSATNFVYEMIIPANSTNGAGFVDDVREGIAFGTGISICVTGGYGHTDTTAATASAMEVNIAYK